MELTLKERTMNIPENLNLNEVFPFEYAGGGYFREKNPKKGEKAKILHGMDAIIFVLKKVKENEKH